MTDAGAPARAFADVPRKVGVRVCLPIVTGTVAWWLGRRADDQHSHKWSAYVRGPNGEDLSYAVRKVVFQLHSSFESPNREVDRFPFELEETGWGEFEIIVRVHFVDQLQESAELRHMLKLYPPAGTAPSTKKPVVKEIYDEIVFESPTESFYNILMEGPKGPTAPLPDYATRLSEEEELAKIAAAQQYVTRELEALQKRLHDFEAERVDEALPQEPPSRPLRH